MDSIKCMYNRTVNAVRLNGEISEWFETTRNGVKQGDNLSPTLFNVYVTGRLGRRLASSLHVTVVLFHLSGLRYWTTITD